MTFEQAVEALEVAAETLTRFEDEGISDYDSTGRISLIFDRLEGGTERHRRLATRVMDDQIFEGLAMIFRAGATQSRQWIYNNDCQIQARVYDAMADEAERQTEIMRARHD